MGRKEAEEMTEEQNKTLTYEFAEKMGVSFGEPDEITEERTAEETIYEWDGGKYHE